MTFEGYCIKFSQRNIKKYGNGSNHSNAYRKKGRITVPLITWCWIIWNQKIKVHSFGNSFPQVTLGGFFEISIFPSKRSRKVEIIPTNKQFARLKIGFSWQSYAPCFTSSTRDNHIAGVHITQRLRQLDYSMIDTSKIIRNSITFVLKARDATFVCLVQLLLSIFYYLA